jgi:hypothetical protein
MGAKYRNKLRKFIDEIQYELADGIHTYQWCPYCNMAPTRSGKCAECLLKEFRTRVKLRKKK